MTKKAAVAVKQNKQIGQSLVEVALFLPILVILLAGIVELSQLVITQNRVSNAARTAARFGANGGEDEGIALVALNTITQTLQVREDRWDIWTIHGQVNENGTGIDIGEYEFEHVYGISNTQLFSTVVEANIRDDIWAELQIDETAGAATPDELADLRFVGTYILHDVDSILGLDAFPALANFSSVRALTVMRVTGLNLEPTKGCDAFPIAISDKVRSVTPPGTGSNPFPDESDFAPSSPEPLPIYEHYTNHIPDTPLQDAQEGYLFKIKNGVDPGSFGWLRWNTIYLNGNATELAHSLEWPGDSSDYPTYGYYEPGDPTDTTMNIGDWVAGNDGAVAATKDDLEPHIDLERTLRLIVWDETNGGTGNNVEYHIAGFAIFRILGHNLAQDWILAEFIRWDDSCGQEIQTTTP